MNRQMSVQKYFVNRLSFSISSSSYYNIKRFPFPVKMSGQHFLSPKKTKNREQQFKSYRKTPRQFDIQEIKQRIYQAQKVHGRFNSKSARRQLKIYNKRVKSIEDIPLVPELSIGRQPLRCYTQSTKPKPKIEDKIPILFTSKKKNNQIIQNKSLPLKTNSQQNNTYHITQVIDVIETSRITKQTKKIKNLKQVIKMKQINKILQVGNRNGKKHEDSIKGWQIKQQFRDQLTNLF